jgi:hypothetical protein
MVRPVMVRPVMVTPVTVWPVITFVAKPVMVTLLYG